MPGTGTGTVTGTAVQSLLRLEPLVFVFFGKPFGSLTQQESTRRLDEGYFFLFLKRPFGESSTCLPSPSVRDKELRFWARELSPRTVS